MELYLSGFAGLFIVFVYLPALFFLLRWVWRRMPRSWAARLAVVLGIFVATTGALFWDVIDTTIAMRKACATEAGLHVYKTAEAEGFYSDFAYANDVDFQLLPYEYIEGRQSSGGLERLHRENGQIKHEHIDQPKSRYHVFSLRDELLPHNMSRKQFVVRDTTTGETLARSVTIRAYPGWLDRTLLAIWGPVVWLCDARRQPNELVKSTLIPKRKTE